MNTVRKYLIPFPAPAKNPSIDDTVYALPRAEVLFEPAPKLNLKRISLPRLPQTVSVQACLAGILAAVLAGTVVGRITASPSSPVPLSSAALSRLATGQNLANLRPTMPVAAVTVFPTPIVRTQKIRFQLTEAGSFQRVGPFLLKLKRADEKKQTFTLTLQAGDNRVELRDRALAETIRLSPSDQGQSEILVHRIDDNRIEGFMRVQTVTR